MPWLRKPKKPVKLHIARRTGFDDSLFCWSIVMPLRGRGKIEASWFNPTGLCSVEIKRQEFAVSQEERAGSIATAQTLPTSLGCDVMNDAPCISIGVEVNKVITWSTLTLYDIPATEDVRAFNTIIDSIWPEAQAALQTELRPLGRSVGDWRDGLGTR